MSERHNVSLRWVQPGESWPGFTREQAAWDSLGAGIHVLAPLLELMSDVGMAEDVVAERLRIEFGTVHSGGAAGMGLRVLVSAQQAVEMLVDMERWILFWRWTNG